MNVFHIENIQEWGKYLVEKYPLILKEFDPDVAYYFKGDEKDRVNLRYGFEFSSGWKLLAEETLAKATDLVQKARKIDPKFFIHGFIWKQKFATLLWQGSEDLPEEISKEWWDFLSDMEERSMNVCENCGQPGKVDGTGSWIEVKCGDCK